MSTIVNTIDRVVTWVDENICQKITLKIPPEDEEAPDGPGYDYASKHPACFPLFVPGSDKLPPQIKSPFPSICVRLADGNDFRNSGTINLELCFSGWNPGIHGRDLLNPVTGQPLTFREWTGAEAEVYFVRSVEGWRDLWNWIDIALREIEKTETIDGMRVNLDKGINFSPYKEDGGVTDFYPYWFGFISFGIEREIVRKRNFSDLL